MDKTTQLVVGVLIVAFVIERITAAITFFIDDMTPAERKRKRLLLSVGGVLAAIAVWQIDIRLLRDGLGTSTHPVVDTLLTWLVIVGGADRIGSLVGTDKPQAATEAKPTSQQLPDIHITVIESDGKIRDVVRQVS